MAVIMPTYSYKCIPCKTKEDRFAFVEDRDSQECRGCGCALDRDWSETTTTAIHVFEPHWDDGLGRRVESNRQRKELCKELKLEPM